MAQAADDQSVNGSARDGLLAAAGGGAAIYDDPMSKVFGLDAQTSGVVAWIGYFLGAVALLLGLLVVARAITLIRALHEPVETAAAIPQEIDVMRDEAPPPPPAPEPEAKAEPPPRATPHEAPPPPPAPAQAGKVLTQEPDPNEPVDLTGTTIVSGNADEYAGGVTAANGTSKTAVRGLTSPGGVPGGTGAPQAAPVPSGPDRSRNPSLANPQDWNNCPFPPEADTAQIDEADVTIEVSVRADGRVESTHVLRDPGNGFGREAVRCAMTGRGKYLPALDRAGNPIAGNFKVHLRFSR